MMKRSFSALRSVFIGFLLMSTVASAANPMVEIDGDRILVDGRETKLLGLRCSNALISDGSTVRLIAQLDTYRSVGLNTISVFLMGSRFGDIKGYRPDGSLEPVYRERFERILDETQRRGMVVIVGCLYWGTSKAKEELEAWTQDEADRAVANTADWLKENGYRHVILDPDNEGMSCEERGWSVESMIAAAHRAFPGLLVANNTRQNPPNEDLNMHFGEREAGKPWLDSESTPTNAPGGYWRRFSKETHLEVEGFHNYSRVGRYTEEMKERQLRQTAEGMESYNGNLLASTWLQCAPHEGVGGPFATFGGLSELGSSEDEQAAWNRDIDRLHPDAGIRWWIDFVAGEYGTGAP